VVADAEPSATIFGVAPEFIEAKAAIRAHEHIDADPCAVKVDGVDDFVTVPHFRQTSLCSAHFYR
jgi:hypothetical protein